MGSGLLAVVVCGQPLGLGGQSAGHLGGGMAIGGCGLARRLG